MFKSVVQETLGYLINPFETGKVAEYLRKRYKMLQSRYLLQVLKVARNALS